jgi:hypothetical protein
MALLHHHHHHHQSSWQNGLCNGDFTNENPFLKPPKIHQAVRLNLVLTFVYF